MTPFLAAILVLAIGLALVLRGRGMRRSRGLGQGRTLDLDSRNLYSRRHGLAGRPDRIVEGGIPEEWKSSRRVYDSHRAQMAVYFILIEEETGVRPPHGFIVTGDRAWYAPELAEQALNRLLLRYGPGFVIIHGGATGIDRSFAEACGDLNVEQEAHPARWGDLDSPGAVIRYDKQNRPYNANSGPDRNQEMIDLGADLCLAFHRAISSSKGTKDCARRAITAGIPTYLIDSDRAEPKRLRAGDARLR